MRGVQPTLSKLTRVLQRKRLKRERHIKEAPQDNLNVERNCNTSSRNVAGALSFMTVQVVVAFAWA